MTRSAVLAVLAIALSSAPAFAQRPLLDGATLTGLDGPIAEPVAAEATDLPIVYNVVVRAESRPSPLLSLYVAQGALQGLDVLTTFRALDAGHREANPLLKNANMATMIGAKVAVSSLTVFAAEKLWKRNRRAAVVLMVASNIIMSAVVANNARVLRH